MSEKFEYTRSWENAEDFPLLSFSKNWENPSDYPTIETDEAQVRRDMQSLHDEVKNYLNDVLIPKVIAEDATVAAWTAAEEARAAAEAERAAAEQIRAAVESDRAETETARAAAESNRAEAETGRAQAEAERAAAEQARVDSTSGIVAQATEQGKAAAEHAERASGYAGQAVASAGSASQSAADASDSANQAALSAASANSAQTAAETARTAAETAQTAAEKARDDARTIVGGDFSTKTEAQAYANTAESNAKAYTDQEIAALPDSSGVFVAVYGETSYQDVLDAYNEGKMIFCKDTRMSQLYERIYILTYYMEGYGFTFTQAPATVQFGKSAYNISPVKVFGLSPDMGWREPTVAKPHFSEIYMLGADEETEYKLTIDASGQLVVTET